ncbi:MAG: hypothetical protein ABJL44_03620 [Algibacter sp.]
MEKKENYKTKIKFRYMKKLNYLRISGIALALSGLSMILSDNIGVPTAKVLVPVLIIAAGLFSFLFSTKNSHFRIAKQYHLLQGIGLTICGLLVAMLPNSLEDFLMYIAYFVLLLGFLEFTFAYQVLNAKIKNFNWNMIISRFIAAMISFISAIVLLLNSVDNPLTGLMIAGAVTIIGGISILLFANKIKDVNPTNFPE